MTEFELVTLFNEFFDATFARLNDFMAGTFAMLIAAYFAAARLTPKMAGLVVFLYSLFSIATFVPIIMATTRFVRSAELLEEISQEPDSVVETLFPFFPSPPVVLTTMVLLLVGSYLGTLAFFIQARKIRASED